MGIFNVITKWLAAISGWFKILLANVKASKWGQWLWFTLFTWLGGILGRIFTLLGVTLVVNEFVTPELTPIVAGHLLGMPTHWVQLLALTKIDQALTILISAMGIAVADKISVQRRQNAWQQPL